MLILPVSLLSFIFYCTPLKSKPFGNSQALTADLELFCFPESIVSLICLQIRLMFLKLISSQPPHIVPSQVINIRYDTNNSRRPRRRNPNDPDMQMGHKNPTRTEDFKGFISNRAAVNWTDLSSFPGNGQSCSTMGQSDPKSSAPSQSPLMRPLGSTGFWGTAGVYYSPTSSGFLHTTSLTVFLQFFLFPKSKLP